VQKLSKEAILCVCYILRHGRRWAGSTPYGTFDCDAVGGGGLSHLRSGFYHNICFLLFHLLSDFRCRLWDVQGGHGGGHQGGGHQGGTRRESRPASRRAERRGSRPPQAPALAARVRVPRALGPFHFHVKAKSYYCLHSPVCFLWFSFLLSVAFALHVLPFLFDRLLVPPGHSVSILLSLPLSKIVFVSSLYVLPYKRPKRVAMRRRRHWGGYAAGSRPL